MESVATINSVS